MSLIFFRKYLKFLNKFNFFFFSKEVALCKSAKGREKEQKIMLEGKRLIYDALTAKLQPLKFFFTRTEELKNFKLPINVELYKICYNEMKVWSDVKTPQGVIGKF